MYGPRCGHGPGRGRPAPSAFCGSSAQRPERPGGGAVPCRSRAPTLSFLSPSSGDNNQSRFFSHRLHTGAGLDALSASLRRAVSWRLHYVRARIGPFGLRGDARGRCRPRRERIAKPATPRPVLRPLGKAQGQRCRTRRHLRRMLRRLPHTEHPPQPAGGLRRRILGVVGSTRRRSARRRTGCGCSTARSARRAGQQMAPGQRRSKSGFASNFDPEPTGYGVLYARTKSIAHPARTPPHRCASAGTPNYPPDKYDAPRQRQRDAPLALMHASSRLTRQRLHASIVGIGHTRMQYVMPAVRR